MHNLKRFGGTFKGLIGECMFKLTRENLILTRFFSKSKYFNIFSKYLSQEQINFLDKNWYSLDALEVDYSKMPRKIVLFEIKTLNDFYYAKLKGINRIPQMTLSTIQIYEEAKNIGFDVKIAIIWLKNDWNYEIEITDFDKSKCIIEKPKKYDKGATF